MYQTTSLTCPLCGNTWHFVHTYHTEPTLGYCERCDTHYNGAIHPRTLIEHRRPKTLYDYPRKS